MWELGADEEWHEKVVPNPCDIINNIQTNLIDYINVDGQCVLNAPVRTIQVRSEDDLQLLVASGYGAGTRAYLPTEETMWECDASGEWHDITSLSTDIQEAVTDWLDDHPEATTTVADGSITNAKLDASLQTAIDDVGNLNDAMADLYLHEDDTDAYYWRPNVRVNSAGSYATSQTHYTGIYLNSNRDMVYVYPGSKIQAKTGYTMDYSVKAEDGTTLEFQREIAAGTVVTISHYGILRVSVTDGTSATSPDSAAKAVAKAGLEIDLVVEPIRNTVDQNKEDIAAMSTKTETISTALEYGREFSGFIAGKTITTNVSVGETVDITLNSTATMSCGIVAVSAGDKYILTGKALTQSLLWAFTDESYKLISKSAGNANVTDLTLVAPEDGYLIVNIVTASPHSLYKQVFYENIADDVKALQVEAEKNPNNDMTDLVAAQKSVSDNWHFSFINIYENMGLGSAHIIPGTKTIWKEAGTVDLTQKEVWMEDGVHPFLGPGVTDMYARTIASQLAMVVPSYKDGVGETSPSVWAGRTFLWTGTSIPANSDPDAGDGTGSSYPALVATLLGATSINKAKGSSCLRVNSSTGEYTGMIWRHFLRALTRTQNECDALSANWANIKDKIGLVPDAAYSANNLDAYLATMKAHSYEALIMPYLDGTETMPDLFVIDHGHNDVRPRGIDGKNDLWIEPTLEMIQDGVLAEDTYMTANNYANLKTALGNDLSGIPDVASFAATLNRNCFKGAVNFLVTLILRYNPYARIVFVSDYN